jgi:hypothetical protein
VVPAQHLHLLYRLHIQFLRIPLSIALVDRAQVCQSRQGVWMSRPIIYC